jgi:hypothetical protein
MDEAMNIFRIPAVKTGSRPQNYPIAPAGSIAPTAQRLVVTVPNGEFSAQALARKLGMVGLSAKKKILFLGLASSPPMDSLLRRRMAALSAYTRSPNRETDYRLVFRANWLGALDEVLQDGDQVVCLENHFVAGRFFRNVRLAQLLTSSLRVPVCVVHGITLYPDRQARSEAVREFLVWVSNLLTIILFLIVQIRCTQAYPGGLGTILGTISMGVEMGVILLINSVFDRSPV